MKKSILGCAVAVALVNSVNVSAGGLWLNQHGDFSGGRAGSGEPWRRPISARSVGPGYR